MRFIFLAVILMPFVMLVCSGCSECKPDCNGKCCGDDGCGGKCKDTCADSDLLCNPFTCTCAKCIEGCTSNADCENEDAYCIPDECICVPKNMYCRHYGTECKTDADCIQGERCANRFPDCVCQKECGEPDGDSCPPGCQAVLGMWYSHECRCAFPVVNETMFCREDENPCNGPSQVVQDPSGYCVILEKGCGDDLPTGWLQGCCELPATPAPDYIRECEGCVSDADCQTGQLCVLPCQYCIFTHGCELAPSQESTVPCGGEPCQVFPCIDNDPDHSLGRVCVLPWWATGLMDGDVGLAYVVEGNTYSTWDEIVMAFGRCSSAHYLIRADPLETEGYVTENPPTGVCKYPVDCGVESCGIETTFCCTDQTAGGITSCKTYDEILPARNGVTVDLDQRTCTLP